MLLFGEELGAQEDVEPVEDDEEVDGEADQLHHAGGADQQTEIN